MARQSLSARTTDKAPTAFRTITEVAAHLGVQQHVLRFWETKFPHVRPVKGSGGRRYYRPTDVSALQEIRDLLHAEGYTIRGAQKLLRTRHQRPAGPQGAIQPTTRVREQQHDAAAENPTGTDDVPGRQNLLDILSELEAIRMLLPDGGPERGG